MNNVEHCIKLTNELTKESLLKRARYYIEAEAKKRKVEPWVIVGHIFAEGSGVSQTLWERFIKEQKEPVTE